MYAMIEEGTIVERKREQERREQEKVERRKRRKAKEDARKQAELKKAGNAEEPIKLEVSILKDGTFDGPSNV